MDKKQRKWTRKYILFGLIFVLVILLQGCEFPTVLSDQEAPSEEAALPSPSETDTTIPSNTPSNTPTNTNTPTKTIIPSATTKPTLRPSATDYIPTQRPTWTASPTLSPTATPDVGVFLTEDFSDIKTPWLQRRGANWNTFIVHGEYYLSVHAPNIEITSARPWIRFIDVRIEADIRHNNGNGYYGFSCRESSGDYYTVFVTTDGYYGFGQLYDLKVEFFELHPVPKLEIPFDGKGTNHLRVECRSNLLTIAINGEIIDTYDIVGHGPKGFVGMMAGTRYEDNRLVVAYDNLVIWTPELPDGIFIQP